MMPSKLSKARNKAYRQQHGLCVYCEKPMWLDDPEAYANKYLITLRQAKIFRCTAEHLVARQDGGKDNLVNIAAACLFCNRLRHNRKTPLEPLRFKSLVARRLKKSRWNTINRPVHIGVSSPIVYC